MKPYYKTELGKLYCGNCVDIIPSIEKIDLTITSPPYDNLRDYEGYTFNFKEIARNIYQITQNGGILVWIVADATINGSETGTSFKQALYFKEIGFHIHDTMIWVKDQMAFPSSTRYYNAFEYMFVLSKGKPKTINLIRDKINKTIGQKAYSTARNKDGTLREKSGIRNLTKYGVRWNYWLIYNQARGIHSQHPATFPEKLAIDHIISWSNGNDIILDPMSGSGTTCLAAEKLNRKWIGIETSEKYCEIAAKRIEKENKQQKLF